MKRAGILVALERRHYPRRMNDDMPEPPSVTLKRVQTFFVLFGTGFLSAVLFLTIEITIHKMSKGKRNVKPKLFSKKQSFIS
jgi:hypothetical protein